MSGEPRVRFADHRLGSRGVVGEQDRVHAHPTAVAIKPHDGRIPDPVVANQHCLDVVGVHLLTVRQSDHVLLPPAEREKAIGAELAEVAG